MDLPSERYRLGLSLPLWCSALRFLDLFTGLYLNVLSPEQKRLRRLEIARSAHGAVPRSLRDRFAILTDWRNSHRSHRKESQLQVKRLFIYQFGTKPESRHFNVTPEIGPVPG